MKFTIWYTKLKDINIPNKHCKSADSIREYIDSIMGKMRDFDEINHIENEDGTIACDYSTLKKHIKW